MLGVAQILPQQEVPGRAATGRAGALCCVLQALHSDPELLRPNAAPGASGCSALPGVLDWLRGLQRGSRVPLGTDPELPVPRLGLTQLCPTASREARRELLP